MEPAKGKAMDHYLQIFVFVYRILAPLKTLKVYKTFHSTILVVFPNFLQNYRDFFLASITKSVPQGVPALHRFWDFKNPLYMKFMFVGYTKVKIVNLRRFYVK